MDGALAFYLALLDRSDGGKGGGGLKDSALCFNRAPVDLRNGSFAFNLEIQKHIFLGLLCVWASTKTTFLKTLTPSSSTTSGTPSRLHSRSS